MNQQKLDQLIEWQQRVNCDYIYWQKTSSGWVDLPDANQRRTCPHCKMLGNAQTMRRWHGQNCHQNPNKDLYD